MHIDYEKAYGILTLRLFDENGNLKQEVEAKNKIVDAGLAFIASRMKDATATAMTHMGVGTTNTAAAAGQTDLVAIAGSRVLLDSTTLVTTTGTNDSIQYVCTFGAGISTGSLVEAGIFNNGTNGAGTMLCRTVFGVITKAAGDSLVVTWKIVMTSAT